jgi:uncharacterized membrane protein
MKDATLLQGDWEKIMAEDLLAPTFKLSRLDAISRRFTRNYVWIFGVIQAAWFLKLWLHYPESHETWGILKALTADNPVPAGFFLFALAAFYGYLLFLLFWGIKMRTTSGEFLVGAMRRNEWI